jgi:predicted transcriptional regulator
MAKRIKDGQTTFYKTLHRKQKAVYRRTDNTVAKRIKDGQTTFYKTLHRKQKAVYRRTDNTMAKRIKDKRTNNLLQNNTQKT